MTTFKIAAIVLIVADLLEVVLVSALTLAQATER